MPSAMSQPPWTQEELDLVAKLEDIKSRTVTRHSTTAAAPTHNANPTTKPVGSTAGIAHDTATPKATTASTKPVSAMKTTAATTSTNGVIPWTDADDITLIGARVMGKTWTEIETLFPGKGKTKSDLLDRGREVFNSLDPATLPSSETIFQTMSAMEERRAAREAEAQRQMREGGKPKNPFKVVERSVGDPSKGMANIPEGKGIVMTEDGRHVTRDGRPVIYIDPNGDMTKVHLLYAYAIAKEYEDAKWDVVAYEVYRKHCVLFDGMAYKKLLGHT